MASPTSFLFLVLYISPDSLLLKYTPKCIHSSPSSPHQPGPNHSHLHNQPQYPPNWSPHFLSCCFIIHSQNTHFLYKIYFSSSTIAFFLFLKNTKLSHILVRALYSLSPLPGMFCIQIFTWLDSFCYSCLSSDLISERPFMTTLFYVLQNTYHSRQFIYLCTMSPSTSM